MMSSMRNKIITAFLLSATVTAIFIAVITIAGELAPPLKDWLKLIFFHHWLGKSALAGILFFTLGILFSFISPRNNAALSASVHAFTWTSVLSALVIFAFFIAEAFHLF